jgi:hypothetical protein
MFRLLGGLRVAAIPERRWDVGEKILGIKISRILGGGFFAALNLCALKFCQQFGLLHQFDDIP